MKRQLKGAILLVIIGALVIVGVAILKPYFQNRGQVVTSDAKHTKATFTVGLDSWIGYFPYRSKEMARRMRSAGYNFRCLDDNSDLPARMEKLKKGDLNFAVMTVDSTILNGPAADYPGVIIKVIDESCGGDKVIGRDGIKSLDDLKKMKNFKIAYTPMSPSEHLLKAVAVHFDIPELKNKKGKWRIETNGSGEALKKFLAGEVNVAVLWEPDVSRAMALPGVTKLLGTEDTKRYIVDVLLVSRRFAQDSPELVNLVLYNYFQTLKHYRDNQGELVKEVIEETHLPEEQAKNMLNGVKWAGLYENAAEWFGIGTPGQRSAEGLIETIEATARILKDYGDFKSSPLPGDDPYRLINRSFIADLYNREFSGLAAQGDKPAIQISTLDKRFSPLDDAAWKGLKEIGTLKTLPVTFSFGTAQLDLSGKATIDQAIKNLEHFPNYRIIIKGHTGLMGDPEANKVLSQERADSVKRYLEVTYNVDPNRMRAVGFGSVKPLPKEPGESEKAHNYRLPRVELYLVTEIY